jgi:hypothetical protein
MKRNKKIEFLMNTDWMFEKPIDKEHKEYKLLSYFQKMGEKLDNLELYPSFIELSLHLANVQTLIKDRKIVYTNKRFLSVDDELLVKDLKIKDIPEMDDSEGEEFIKILTYTAPKMLEYFNIAKSVWTIVFDSVDIKPKRNKKNSTSTSGYFYYMDKNTNKKYVWRYDIKQAFKKSPERKTLTNLIFSDTTDLTIPKIIDTFGEVDKTLDGKLPVFEMTCNGEFPIEQTLLPLFKRKLITYVGQNEIISKYKKLKDRFSTVKDDDGFQ